MKSKTIPTLSAPIKFIRYITHWPEDFFFKVDQFLHSILWVFNVWCSLNIFEHNQSCKWYRTNEDAKAWIMVSSKFNGNHVFNFNYCLNGINPRQTVSSHYIFREDYASISSHEWGQYLIFILIIRFPLLLTFFLLNICFINCY